MLSASRSRSKRQGTGRDGSTATTPGGVPNEKDGSGGEMEARENFEPRGCWCVTKQRRWQKHGQIL